MKKKKVELLRKFNFWSDNFIKIDKEGDQYYFEIGSEVTTDISEAVAIMMTYQNKDINKFWELEIKDIDYYNIRPELAIYWLSGGDYEWKIMNNYKKTWNDYNKSGSLLTPTNVLPQIHIRIGGGAGDEEYKFKIDDWVEELHRIDQYLHSEGFTLSTLNYLHSDLESAIKALSGRELIGITLYYKLKK